MVKLKECAICKQKYEPCDKMQMYSIPTDAKTRLNWSISSGVNLDNFGNSAKVCEKHFCDDDFQFVGENRRLIYSALPQKFYAIQKTESLTVMPPSQRGAKSKDIIKMQDEQTVDLIKCAILNVTEDGQVYIIKCNWCTLAFELKDWQSFTKHCQGNHILTAQTSSECHIMDNNNEHMQCFDFERNIPEFITTKYVSPTPSSKSDIEIDEIANARLEEDDVHVDVDMASEQHSFDYNENYVDETTLQIIKLETADEFATQKNTFGIKRQRMQWENEGKENNIEKYKDEGVEQKEDGTVNSKVNKLKRKQKENQSNIILLKPVQCKICYRIFLNEKNMQKHHELRHKKHNLPEQEWRKEGKPSFRCKYCEAHFNELTELTSHLAELHENHDKSFELGDGKNIEFDLELIDEQQQESETENEESSEDPNANDECLCSICLQAFENKTDLEQHLRLQHCVQLHCCQGCGAKFEKFADYLAHKESSNCMRKYYKYKAYETSVSYKMNAKDKPIKNFACKICQRHFTTQEGLQRHLKTVHLALEGTNEQLEQANKNSKRNLHHYVYDAATKQKRLLCQYCGNTYAKHNGLHKHQLSVHGMKPLRSRISSCNEHICQICNRRFTHANSLTQHHSTTHLPLEGTIESLQAQVYATPARLKMTAGELVPCKVFKCKQCNKTFVIKDMLTKHMQLMHEKCNDKQDL